MRLSRRTFLWFLAASAVGALWSPKLLRLWKSKRFHAETFAAKASDYNADLAGTILLGFRELGISISEIKNKRILLKPNLVETWPGVDHINTHPLVIRGAVEAFKSFGAKEVIVAEGAGHCRDSFLLLEESGLGEVLVEDKIRFIDLNYDDCYTVPVSGINPALKNLTLPKTLRKVDWIVSMAKMKTHHWAGVTLSMKNLFGLMPGSFYGWPKNVLHFAGIHESIQIINETVCPHLAIVDGIVGMEGDGPIMGKPHPAGVLVMGRNFPAVDATCSRIMGINPKKIEYLASSHGRLGTINASNIQQRGESINSVQSKFSLINKIPAHQGIRL